jgi:hypothetical protein
LAILNIQRFIVSKVFLNEFQLFFLPHHLKQLHPIINPQLPINIQDVFLQRIVGDIKLGANFIIVHPIQQTSGNNLLPFSQAIA